MTTKQKLIHPVKSLPGPMQAHLKIPMKVLYLWMAISAVFLASFWLMDPGTSESTSQTNSDSYTPNKTYGLGGVDSAASSEGGGDRLLAQVKVSGDREFDIKVKDKGTRLYWNGTTYKVETTEKDVRITYGGQGTMFRLKDKGDKVNIYDNTGLVLFKIDRDAEGELRVKDNSGTLQYRIKLKGSSYNVYDGAGTRILKGKSKGGHFNVDHKPGDQRSLKIKGESSLIRAAVLSIPLDAPIVAMLWQHLER